MILLYFQVEIELLEDYKELVNIFIMIHYFMDKHKYLNGIGKILKDFNYLNHMI